MRFFRTLAVVTCLGIALGGHLVAGPKGASAGLVGKIEPVRAADAAGVPSDLGIVEAMPAIAPDSVMPFEDAGDGTQFLLVRYTSTGAEALRVHLRNLRLPAGARLYVYTTDAEGNITREAGPFEGAGPLRSGEFWTDALPGDTVTVELQIEGERPSDLPFEVAELARVSATAASVISRQVESSETEIRTSEYRGRALTHAVVDGVALFEGDIELGNADELQPASTKDQGRQSVAITGSRYRWPNGVVPYVIDPVMPDTYRITNAINHWNTMLAGHVRFVPRTSEYNHVKFAYSSNPGTCSSSVGMVGYGQQLINLGNYCSTGNAIHEAGHALGLWHEQGREDRNTYVEILTANITSSSLYNFNQHISNGDDIGAYDFGSIMHYPEYAFSSNGLPTIRTKPAGIAIGQRSGLSAGDVAAIKALYPATSTPTAPTTPTTPTAPTTPSTPISGNVTVTINSNPAGRQLVVDGTQVNTPYTVTWIVGSAHTVSAPNPAPVGGVRYTFVKWSDGGAQTHTLSAANNMTALSADFATHYQLTAAANPAGSVAITTTPASADGYYPANSTVQVNLTNAASGYCFSSWTGLLAGTSSSPTLSMTKPYQITANMGAGAVTLGASSVIAGVWGGNGSFPVSASTGCGWTAVAGAPWVWVWGGATGTGTGYVNYLIRENYTGAPRNTTITVNGKVFNVTQY